MAGWTLKTLGGTDLNPSSGVYTTKLARHQMRFQAGARTVQTASRGDLYPTYAGSMLESRTIQVQHEIAGGSATHETNLNTLKALYDPRHGARTLVFTADSVDKRATVVATRLLPHDSTIGQQFVLGEWVLLEQRFYIDSATSVTAVAKTASPATLSVANAGTAATPAAVITLQPTAAKDAADGQLYARAITVINRSERPLVNWPVDLCDTDRASGAGGWDHAAEVTASRSQADGDDVEVYVNGRRVNRWFGADADTGGVNTATTAVWVNLDMPPVRKWTLRADITDAATTAYVKEDLVGMPATPFYAAFDDGTNTETVRVTAVAAATGALTIVRAQRGMSAVAWQAAEYLYWTPILVELVYGGTSLATPTYIDDDYKPIMIADTTNRSTNDRWYHSSSFQETRSAADTQDRKPRGGSWRTRMGGEIDRDAKGPGGDGDMYVRYIPRTATLSTDSATATRMNLAYRSAGAKAGHPIMDRWDFDSPIGIDQVTHTTVTTTLDSAPGGDREADWEMWAIDADGNEELLASHDGTTTTAEALTPSANAYVISCRIAPFDPKVDYTTVDITAGEPTDADGWTTDSVIISFDSDEELVLAWGARRDIYQFGRPDAPATLANSDGDTLSIYGLVVDLNDTVDIDVEARTVTVDDGTGRAHLVSGDWPWLPAGTNNLTYTETGIGTVEIGVSSYRSAWI